MQHNSVFPSSVTKRLGRACTECSRRKIRCDRSTPCHPCLQRNRGFLCSRYNPDNTGTGVRPNRHDEDRSLELENLWLRERVAQLETEIAQSTGIISNRSEQVEEDDADLIPDHHNLHEIESFQTSIENLDLGIQHDPSNSVQNVASLRTFTDLSNPLPSRVTSTKLVRFALSHLSWIHCALQARKFFEQHEHFWTAIDASNPEIFAQSSWLSVYYAVLATAIYYIDMSNDCFSDFSLFYPEASLPPPRSFNDVVMFTIKWYRTSLDQLEISDFLGRPRLATIQTTAILTLLNASVGENDRQWLMMGAAVNMARSLQMDRLGSESKYVQTNKQVLEWSTAEDRRLGRRLWWTLVICDWLGVIGRPVTISPDSFDSKLEIMEFSSEDIVLQPDLTGSDNLAAPSSLHYHLTVAKLAGVIQTYVKGSLGFSKKNLATAMREVESIYHSCPTHLKLCNAHEVASHMNEQNYPWLGLQRYILTHTYHFMRLTIARSHFSQWLSRQTDQHDFHAKAVQAAEAIVNEKHQRFPQTYNKSWIVCASTVAAGVFLCLDLLCFGTGQEVAERAVRRSSIQTCIFALESLDSTSIIAKRGPLILKRLLNLEATWDYQIVPEKATLQAIIKHATVSDQQDSSFVGPSVLSMDFSLTPGSDFSGLIGYGGMEPTISDQDATRDIIANAMNEIESFENPFEFDESGFYNQR